MNLNDCLAESKTEYDRKIGNVCKCDTPKPNNPNLDSCANCGRTIDDGRNKKLECICEGNWRTIVKENEELIGRYFVDGDGVRYRFFGIVHGKDDYYYGVSNEAGKVRLLSCVSDMEGFGLKLEAPNNPSIKARPSPPSTSWEWYSFCSAHHLYEINCPNCNAGNWISAENTEFNNWLWTYSPRIWRKWANRDNISGWREWLRKIVWSKAVDNLKGSA